MFSTIYSLKRDFVSVFCVDCSNLPNRTVHLEKLLSMDLNLPPKYTYCYVSDKEEEKSFLIKEVKDEESAKVWIKKFSEMNFITWRVQKTYPHSKKYLFRKDFRCQHSTDKRCVGVRSSKNTDCPAKLIVKIERSVENSDDPEIIDDFPACISIMKKHNHQIISPDSLKYRDMSEETRSKLCTLFRRGHSPSSALLCLKTDLIFEHGDNYYKIAADGAYLPSMSKAYNLFDKEFKKTYGDSKSGTGDLDNFFKEYNNSGGIGIFQRTADGTHYYVVMISPIMLRAHMSIKQTSELVLLDACGGIDKHRHRLYAFVTPTAAGGLPLGLIISDSEEEKVFYEALMCFKNALSGRGFFSKGYPLVFMTDNDMKERHAILEVFPQTTLLLCQFHLLKAMWSWLLDKKHNIHTSHRQELYYMFKNIVYSYTEDNALEKVSIFVQRSKELNYFNLIEYFQWLWGFRKDWVCCYRKNLMIRGNNTTNYVEVVFRIVKDLIFDRVLAYNLIQMVDYLATRYEVYLKQRLVDFANGRYNKSLLVKMQPKTQSNENFTIECCDTGLFVVHKGNEKFTVDLQRGICSCSLGQSGRLCTHASATLLEVDYSCTSFNVSNESTKALMLYVATGKKGDPGWFKGIESGHFEHDVHSVEITPESMCQPLDRLEKQSLIAEGTPKTVCRSVERFEKQDSVSAEEFKEFENLIQRIKTGLETDPSTFVPAFKKMLSNSKRTASTDSGLVSAMHTFGLYTGVQSGKQKKAKQLIRRSHKTVMGVQPTAIARRKHLLSGRKKLNVGRPVASITCPPQLRSHDYTSFGVLPKRKRKAPHNLNTCVEENKSLGSSKK